MVPEGSELNFSVPLTNQLYPLKIPFCLSGWTGVCEYLYLGKKDVTQVPVRLENGSDSLPSPIGLNFKVTTKTGNVSSRNSVGERQGSPALSRIYISISQSH